jgi:SAM-dependent methyltransferase
MSHRAIFNKIYSDNTWKGGSGLGSTPESTAYYRVFIQNFLRTNHIRSVVDIGCGDWQFSKLIDWTGVKYTGVDVSDVVLANTKAHARDGVEFLELDAINGDLPAADLAIMKDVLQHWSNDEIIAFLPKLNRFGRALITNGHHPAVVRLTNKNIPAGEYRPIDLTQPPFNVEGSFITWFRTVDELKSTFLWTRPGPSSRSGAPG